jgi:hypothetical protein
VRARLAKARGVCSRLTRGVRFMEKLWCWRCQVEIPMLEEHEWQQVEPLLTSFVKDVKRHREYHSSSVHEATKASSPDPALQKYFELTGFREANIDALWHHRASLYGHPCLRCTKPLRTHAAKLCAECGWRKPNDSLEGDACQATRV